MPLIFYLLFTFYLQKLEPAQLRKIQSMDGGLGLPVSRNGVGSQPPPRLSNWTSSSSGLPKLPGGPTVIEEPFKKLKKPSPQSQTQSRSSTPTPSHNGVSRTEGDKKQGGEGRGMAASTSFKSLSDSSSADTTDSKVKNLNVCLLLDAISFRGFNGVDDVCSRIL